MAATEQQNIQKIFSTAHSPGSRSQHLHAPSVRTAQAQGIHSRRTVVVETQVLLQTGPGHIYWEEVAYSPPFPFSTKFLWVTSSLLTASFKGGHLAWLLHTRVPLSLPVLEMSDAPVRVIIICPLHIFRLFLQADSFTNASLFPLCLPPQWLWEKQRGGKEYCNLPQRTGAPAPASPCCFSRY